MALTLTVWTVSLAYGLTLCRRQKSVKTSITASTTFCWPSFLGVQIITGLMANLCRALTRQNTQHSNRINTHAQDTTAHQPRVFFTYNTSLSHKHTMPDCLFVSLQEQGTSLFSKYAQTSSGAHPALYSTHQAFFPNGMKQVTYLYLVPRLRMTGTVPLLLPACLYCMDRNNFYPCTFYSVKGYVECRHLKRCLVV